VVVALFHPESVTVTTARELLARHRRVMNGGRTLCRCCLVPWPCAVVHRASAVCLAAGIRLSVLVDEERTRELPLYRNPPLPRRTPRKPVIRQAFDFFGRGRD
jgi:hypothetical protein